MDGLNMNIERLYLVTDTLKKEIKASQLENHLTTIINALTNNISQPNASYLDQITQGLESLKDALEGSYLSNIPKTWMKVISEIKADDFVGMTLHEKIRSLVTSKQALPNEALREIQEIEQRLKGFITAADQLKSAMQKLGVSYESLEEGEVELSIVLPREIFSNELKGFAEEVKLIDHLVRTASEIATGSPENAEIKQLETSDPTLILIASPAAVHFVLKCVHSILDIYQKVQNIRLTKAQAEKAELEVSLIKQIGDQATTKIQEHIKKFAQEQTKSITDKGRKNELNNQLVIIVKKLAARIDRGMKIEGAVEVPEESEDEQPEVKKKNQTLRSIEDLSEQIKYFSTEEEAILALPLNDDEVQE
jgi:hypothetical protein